MAGNLCECGSCGATGLYSGVGERRGEANICWTCEGKGGIPASSPRATRILFTGRKIRTDIKSVIAVTTTGILNGKPESTTMSYDEFLRKYPDK